ncbi:MAG TPA: tetratricopeptide repeat protein [Symbiobacteriaceae bacterium]|nr:tetratricopeptide repeat protein [Symbiobacteriaceae bacterium]
MRKGPAAWLMVALVLAGCSKVSPQQVGGVSAPPVTQSTEPAPVQYPPGEKHRQALALIGSQQYRDAEAILRTLVSAEPENADAWNDLSLMQIKLMHYDEAAKSARKSLQIRPGFLYAQYNLGWALVNTADWKSAKEPLEAAAQAQTDRPEPLHALGKWHELNKETDKAISLYQKAAALDYEPSQQALAYLTGQQRRQAAADEAVARFPQAPPGVVRAVMQGYIPEGTTRTLSQMMPVRFDAKRPALWAALVSDQSKTAISASVIVYTAGASGSYLDGYSGVCTLPLKNADGKVQLEALPVAGAEHLIVTAPDGAMICGLKGERVEALHRTQGPISITGGGLNAGGQALQFVPAASAYLPAARAETLRALLSEARTLGANVETTEAVPAEVTVSGKPAQALTWEETGQPYRLIVAVKPQGEATLLYTEGELLSRSPYRLGQVQVPGHTFLAVATHQKGAPNGGDVLVLEYDKANGRFRKVFRGTGDGATFGDSDVSTSVKIYRPQGGFDAYRTTYTWDEAQGTFVGGKPVLSPNK